MRRSRSVGHRALQIEAKFSGALTSKDQQIESLTKKIGVLMRAADQQQRIGDIGELDVYNGLKLAYAQDTFERVPKFQAGADITATAMHNGKPAGSGLLEIKNVSAWRADYVPKLLQDQLDGGNDIPVLVTAAFPPGLQPHPQVYKGILICPPGAVFFLHDHQRPGPQVALPFTR